MTRPGAIVVAGGASRRMGADKATLVVDGQRMIDRVLAALSGAGIGPVTVAGPNPGGLDPSVATVSDPPGSRQGPLAGIVNAWAARPLGDPVVVLAVDTLSPSVAAIRLLVRSAASHEAGAVAHDGDRIQPLFAAYRPDFLTRLGQEYADGERSLRRVLGRVPVTVVPIEAPEVQDADVPGDLTSHMVDWPAGHAETERRPASGQ